jgi:hypothetical protein
MQDHECQTTSAARRIGKLRSELPKMTKMGRAFFLSALLGLCLGRILMPQAGFNYVDPQSNAGGHGGLAGRHAKSSGRPVVRKGWEEFVK